MIIKSQDQSEKAKFVNARVTEVILRLHHFTVHELAALTGDKLSSVRTVIQRLKKENFVSLEEEKSKQKKYLRGAPERTYSISKDAEKLSQLMAVAVSTRLSGSLSGSEILSSSYFVDAQQLVDWLLRHHRHIASTVLREKNEEICALLDTVTKIIATKEVSPIVTASIDFERARLSLANDDVNRAIACFTQLSETFKKLGDSERQLNCYDYLFISHIERERKGKGGVQTGDALKVLRRLEVEQTGFRVSQPVRSSVENDFPEKSLVGNQDRVWDEAVRSGEVIRKKVEMFRLDYVI